MKYTSLFRKMLVARSQRPMGRALWTVIMIVTPNAAFSQLNIGTIPKGVRNKE